MNERPQIESSWTRSLQRGEQPSHAKLRDHLLAVHRDYAGFTESCAWRCRDASGRNSYALLAEGIDPARHRKVLDLACGSGALLELCHQRYGPAIKLVGVDMSAEELALARQRIPDDTLQLHHGLAQDLNFIADASIDMVMCHWALTLMDPVAAVLAEVKRVLSRNGVFTAIVDGDLTTAPGYAELHDLIYGWVQGEYPSYGAIELGDIRVRTAAALTELVKETFDGAQVQIEPVVLSLRAAPSVLAKEVAGFFYASFVLSAPVREKMLGELATFFAAQGLDNCTRFAMPINRLVVRQAG